MVSVGRPADKGVAFSFRLHFLCSKTGDSKPVAVVCEILFNLHLGNIFYTEAVGIVSQIEAVGTGLGVLLVQEVNATLIEGNGDALFEGEGEGDGMFRLNPCSVNKVIFPSGISPLVSVFPDLVICLIADIAESGNIKTDACFPEVDTLTVEVVSTVVELADLVVVAVVGIFGADGHCVCVGFVTEGAGNNYITLLCAVGNEVVTDNSVPVAAVNIVLCYAGTGKVDAVTVRITVNAVGTAVETVARTVIAVNI